MCNPGTVQSLSGNSFCVNCDVGRYATIQGTTSCLLCDLGYYANTTGHTLVIFSFLFLPFFIIHIEIMCFVEVIES